MDIRLKVQEKYGEIAKEQNCCTQKSNSCCGDGISDPLVNYQDVDLLGLPQEAIVASLGCANPIVFAQLQPGEVVLDLGSGGGIDSLLASRFVGESGKIYGLDMTEEMLDLANKNKTKMGATNVEFIKGYIEDIPLPDESVDVILSNCVINLSADKKQVLKEAWRVLKPLGRFRIADIVATNEINQSIKDNVGLWCGCLAGSLTIEEYQGLLKESGFRNIKIEIVHPYTKEIIKEEFGSMLNDNQNLEHLDGLFAGALISADK